MENPTTKGFYPYPVLKGISLKTICPNLLGHREITRPSPPRAVRWYFLIRDVMRRDERKGYWRSVRDPLLGEILMDSDLRHKMDSYP